MGGGRHLHVETARRCEAANQQRRRLNVAGQGSQRGALHADSEVAAEMSHEIPSHERRWKRLQREARRLDGAGGQDNYGARRQGQEPALSARLDFNRMDVPLVAWSLTTCASGTRNRRRAASFPPDAPASARMACTRTGRPLYLSKLNKPDVVGFPHRERSGLHAARADRRLDVWYDSRGVFAGIAQHVAELAEHEVRRRTTPISLSTSM